MSSRSESAWRARSTCTSGRRLGDHAGEAARRPASRPPASAENEAYADEGLLVELAGEAPAVVDRALEHAG